MLAHRAQEVIINEDFSLFAGVLLKPGPAVSQLIDCLPVIQGLI